jgi:DNA-binding CsgD family transcriptional regulator
MESFTFQRITHRDDLQEDLDNMKLLVEGRIREFSMEKRYLHKNGSVVWVNLTVSPLWKAGEEPAYHIAVVEDITERKKAEALLQKAKDELEIKVKERTAELEKTVELLYDENNERKLAENALESKNIALREVIKQIDIEKDKLRYDVEVNVKNTLLPILSKLEVPEKSHRYYELMKYHLNELVSSFGREIAKEDYNLTAREMDAREMEICNMIKGGLRSKEISDILHISFETVEKHRKNIRKKVGLLNKSTSLFSFLQKF